MRLAPFLAATALALVAVTAAAQGNAPPAGNGLNGLSDTLNGLSDEQNGQAEAPPPAEAEAQPTETPAEPQPQAEAPAQAPLQTQTVLELFSHIASEPIFDQLRTAEQLGNPPSPVQLAASPTVSRQP